MTERPEGAADSQARIRDYEQRIRTLEAQLAAVSHPPEQSPCDPGDRFQDRLIIELILRSISDLVAFYARPDLRISWANRAAIAAAGQECESLTGQRCCEVWAYCSEPYADCPVLEAFRSGQPQQAERILADGRAYTLRAFPVWDEGSQLHGVVEIGQSVTEQKRASRQLQTERDLLDALFEDLPVGILVWDGAGRLARANPVVEQLIGYPPSAIATLDDWFACVYPDPAQRSEVQKVWELDSGRASAAREIAICTASGERRQIEFRGRFLDDGRSIVALSDVSARRAAEAELKRGHQNLESFFKLSCDLGLVIDPATLCIIAANQAAETLLGWPPRELIGRPVTELHPSERLAEARRVLQAVIAGQERCCTLPLLDHEGNELPADTRFAHGTWDGKPALFGLSRDLSELREAQTLFENVFRSNASLMCISDPATGRVIDLNQAWADVMGLTCEEMRGRTTVELGVFPSIDERNAFVAKLTRQGSETPQELRIHLESSRVFVGEMRGEIIASGRRKYLLTITTDVTRQRELMARLEHDATHDNLTGACNRQHLGAFLRREIGACRRHRRQMSLILFDIDHFKAVNDNHGHLVGDRVLVELVGRVFERIRDCDFLARWGGEEFLVVLPDTDLEGAGTLAERLRDQIARSPLPCGVCITLSAGVACWRYDESESQWVARADSALYAAKSAGRNCVKLAGEPASTD